MLENNVEDINYLQDHEDNELIAKLLNITRADFPRITYDEAIKKLQEEGKDEIFEIKPEWGIDLGAEHEKFLTEKVYGKPIFVYNYPKDIKPFYMRENDDGRTVAAMD